MHYVLDLDDTLYLERDYVLSGFRSIDRLLCTEHGIHGFLDEAWQCFTYDPAGRPIDTALTALRCYSPELLSNTLAVYRAHRPEIRLAKDAEEFLARHSPTSLALLTDGRSISQWSKIEALGLVGRIATILVTGDRPEGWQKPSDQPFVALQGQRPPEMLVSIGDNPAKDFHAPRRLGWRNSFRVRRPGSLHQEKQTPPWAIEIESLGEVG